MNLKMNLTMKTESELRVAVRHSRGQEKTAVLEILHHLIEIESRGLQLKWGFASIYDYCMNELAYTKDEAYYRVPAMKLLKAVPTVEVSLLSGKVSLTTLVKTQVAFNNENKRRREESGAVISRVEKADVLKRIVDASARDCGHILAEHFPQSTQLLEKTKVLTTDRTLIQLSVDNELFKKLEKLKDLVAHKSFDRSWEGLLEVIADIALEQVDPVAIEKRMKDRKEKRRRSKSDQEERVECEASNQSIEFIPHGGEPSDLNQVDRVTLGKVGVDSSLRSDLMPQPQICSATQSKTSSSLRAARKRIRRGVNLDVWLSAEFQCEFVDRDSGRRCASRHGLQTDHRKPVALGGGDDRENLRLLCGAHNRYEANRILNDGRSPKQRD